MKSTATAKYLRFSAQKGRLVANQVRGMPVAKAIDLLSFSLKRAAKPIKAALESAIANAEHNEGADIDELSVSEIYVNEGPTFRRFRARAKGRGTPVLKRTCHVTVKVSDQLGDKK